MPPDVVEGARVLPGVAAVDSYRGTRVPIGDRVAFAVVCAELCGLGHATMRAKARAVTQQEFDAWLREEAP